MNWILEAKRQLSTNVMARLLVTDITQFYVNINNVHGSKEKPFIITEDYIKSRIRIVCDYNKWTCFWYGDYVEVYKEFNPGVYYGLIEDTKLQRDDEQIQDLLDAINTIKIELRKNLGDVMYSIMWFIVMFVMYMYKLLRRDK